MPLMRNWQMVCLIACSCASLFLCLVFLSTAPATAADQLPVQIESLEPQVEKGESGQRTLTLKLTNLTNELVELTATPANRSSGCHWQEEKTLGRGFYGEMKIQLDSRCDSTEAISLKERTYGDLGFPINPLAPKAADPKPQWNVLSKAFKWGFVISLILVIGTYAGWALWRRANGQTWGVHRTLPNLDSTWSLKDNWLTDLSAFAAVFTGIFGSSSVVKAIIGKDAEAMLSVATVGTAVVAALLLVSPMLLLCSKRYETGDDGVRKGQFTIFGLVLAAVSVLTSALGQLYVIYRTGDSLAITSDFMNYLWIPFFFAAVILAIFTVMSLIDMLIVGTTEPPKPPTPLDPAEVAARVVARPLWKMQNLNPEKELLKAPVKDEALKKAADALKAAQEAKDKSETAALDVGPDDAAAKMAAEDAREYFRAKTKAATEAVAEAERAGEPGSTEEGGRIRRELIEAIGEDATAITPLIHLIPYPVGSTSPSDDHRKSRSALL